MTSERRAVFDPEITSLLPAYTTAEYSRETLPELRSARIVASAPVLSDEVERTDHVIHNDPPTIIRLHRPRGAEGTLPCLYAIHGGGYILGDRTMEDARLDAWCRRISCVGVSVEYRLAPEAPYPGALEDCYRGLQWVHEQGPEIGVDRDRIGLVGTSAGGGLAAALALYVRDMDQIPILFQLLVYPMLDDRQITPSSRWEVPVWPPTANRFGWECYLGDLHGKKDIPTYAAPARADDLRGLPPAYVMVGTEDGFVDENIDYAQRLNRAGVVTELHVYAGAPHGFDSLFASAAISRRARRDVGLWIERQFRLS